MDEGAHIRYVALSDCGTYRPVESRGILREECLRSTKVLGIDDVRILGYEVRQFTRDRQRILDDFIRLRDDYDPDLVLAPSLDDTHQDHYTVAREAQRAFKYTRLLGYEEPWNNYSFTTTMFVELDEVHLDRKKLALSEYVSQQERTYMRPEYAEAHSRVRGVQAGVDLAEAFEVIRWYL